MSSNDMFDSGDDMSMTELSFSPPSITPKSPTPTSLPPDSSSYTPPTPSPIRPTPSQGSLLAVPDLLSQQSFHEAETFSIINSEKKNNKDCSKICLEFLDENGAKVSPSRYIMNTELLKIVKSMVLSENPKVKHSTAVSIVNSELLKAKIQKRVLKNLYREFSVKVELWSKYRNRCLNKENSSNSNGGENKKKIRIGKSLKSKLITQGSLYFWSKSSLTAMMTKFKALDAEAKQSEHEVDSLQEEKVSKLVEISKESLVLSVKITSSVASNMTDKTLTSSIVNNLK